MWIIPLSRQGLLTCATAESLSPARAIERAACTHPFGSALAVAGM